ncbi:MAG TPA: GGDEF domain-containing protein [Solirubrobacteraceae bacterium]|nr:GGDEF domain-containing protein [Solirubrobacteraceae bacterium]
MPLAAIRALWLAGVAAAAVIAGGAGYWTWACVPLALVAVARAPGRLAAAASLATVIGAAVLAAEASGARSPSATAIALIGSGCAAVVLEMRERLAREREELREFALRDAVTGIANRRSLLIRAGYEVQRHRRSRRSFALVMLDLDGFKGLNDRFGHAAGDDLLRDVAAALRAAMRAQDTVARLGGDEFCVLAPETGERGGALLVAKALEAVRSVSAGLDSVSGSAGLAIFPFDGDTPERLMHAADVRLLEAKRERYRAHGGASSARRAA